MFGATAQKMLAVVVAATTSIALSGCGGGGSDTAVIGVAAPLSGEAAVYGGPVDTVTRAVVNRVNELGGINGTKLEVVSEDEKFNAEDGVRAVTKLINKDDAQFIIGPTSATFMATLGQAERNTVAIASPYSGIVEFDDQANPYTFRTVGPDTFDGLTVAKNIWDRGFKTLSIMYENSDSARSTSSWVESFYTKLGGKVVAKVAFNGGQGSYLPEVRSAFAPEPEMVFLAGSVEPAVTLVREWARQGIPGHWSFIAELTYPVLLDEVGPQFLEGAFGQAPLAAESPATEGMRQLLVEEYGEEKGGHIVQQPSAGTAYDAIVSALLAMAAGGEPTGAAVADNLHKVTDSGGTPVYTLDKGLELLAAGETIDYQGASGPVDFTKTNTATSDYGVYQVTGGQWKVVQRYAGRELYHLAEELS
ncbi:ABC transporter substrate-binding protein [Mycobacterium sp. 21AC1]|uniref:ABC transporter substrate-binding protein n=1 Tax=[Mycobacterium] appelbergii TaxID=2939269 RepID=UPI002939425F|nr:ABC transporter substrate-binding protein [Mycobacterium sp. 21AC1]MDV3125908.1 ABC transporter substrate-binding protein [Mycobacterium sp. 21AC1]